MYIPSEKYITASKKINRNPKSKIVVDGVEYTGMDIIKVHPVISHEATKMIGDFPTKSCKFTLFNRNNQINFVGKDINVYRGLVLDDDTVEYIPQGIFNVKTDDVKSSSTAKTIEFSVKDKSIIFDDLYGGEENVLYPTTVKIFIEEMCNRRGITLETQTFPFSDLILQQRPNFDLNSTTERWLIAKAAELGGCNAQISRTGGLVISKPLIVNQTIKRIDYKSLASKENVFGPINYVALSNANYTNDIVSKDDASITEHGKTEWKLLDNPYVDLIRESIVDSIANELFGMTIIPFELNDTIDSYLYDINDRITIQDKSGNFFDTTILSVNSTSRIFTNLKANVQENSQTDHMLAGSSKNDIKQVKLDVDHVKNNITAIATEVSDQNEKITKVEQDSESIKETIENSIYYIDDNGEKQLISSTIYNLIKDVYGIDLKLMKVGGTNLIKNSVGLFDGDFWNNMIVGFTNTEIQQNTESQNVILTKNYNTDPRKQIIQRQNGTYSVFFKYKKLLELATVSIKINDHEIILDSLDWKEENYTFEVLSNTIEIEINSDSDDSCWIGDLVCRSGAVAGIWSFASGESSLGGVLIGSGIKLISSVSKIMQKIDNDGNRIINTTTGNVVTEHTAEGIDTNSMKAKKAEVARILMQDMADIEQTFLNRL